MSNKKIRKDYAFLSDRKKSLIASTNKEDYKKLDGWGGRNLIEPDPNFLKADNEKVLSNSNNSWIVLGRDRKSVV
jgi:hypothetical protein